MSNDAQGVYQDRRTNMAKELTRKQAQSLWEKAWDALANYQAALAEIIETQAWLPLGHETFHDAWLATRRNELTLDKALQPLVIYQMISEGLTNDEISELVLGVGPATVDKLKRQRKNGVPADQASTASDVKAHPRLTRPHTLHLYVGSEQMDEYHRIAAKSNGHVLAIALEAVDKRFRELANEDA
jgi:hypothetical protein